ncbi:MAG: alpha-L-arabinofuranosidase C-terminal domain-containing protein [Calditrichaceae bacterium]
MKLKSILIVLALTPLFVCAQNKMNKLVIYADSGKYTISKHIYGQFSEHLGRGIYEGLWVGEDSDIPNTRGIRNDVLKALKKIHVPNLRWPGGCFADEYHWMEGIGDPAKRPKMINTHWGGVVEDNSFGTHQFLDLCEMLGAEPYITGNVGSGTVEEMADWVEYLTFDGTSPMSDLRRKNGHDKPWKIKYWGVGNESWGCGGNMRPEYYADLYNRFATYCRDYSGNKLYRIAGGSYHDDYNWTEVLLKIVKHNLMDGISMHFYTINRDWNDKASATEFDEAGYFLVVNKATGMDKYIAGHTKLLDKYDPQNTISLILDEWGAWHAEEPGTKIGFLYQQNTLRDAMVAALHFNIFHKHCRRVHMTNIAQMVNVLQALILTDKEKMILTPTYHVFDMYQDNMDATYLPSELTSEDYVVGGEKMEALSASSSLTKDGKIIINLVNVHASKTMDLNCELKGIKPNKVAGKILTAEKINSYNSFDNPDNVILNSFKDFKIKNDNIVVKMPAKSIVVLKVEK